MASIVAFVTVARNRPTRTADYGPAPQGHPKHGRLVGTGDKRRPAKWTRQLRAGRTFPVEALEAAALAKWIKANPEAKAGIVIATLAQPLNL